MNTYLAEASRVIKARPDDVYAVISDYHAGHPAILPSRYFTDLAVTEGGQGEGTAIDVGMKVFGARFLYHMAVTEPEPGRLLVEEDKEAGVVTSFTVDPAGDGGGARVTIRTEAKASLGLRGVLEKLMNPRIMRRIYREELAQLAEVMANRNGFKVQELETRT